MRLGFEDSCNINILNWKLYQKSDFISTWSLQKVEFLGEIMSFLLLKFEYTNYLFPIERFRCAFLWGSWVLGLTFFAKIVTGSCVFCCSSCISFIPTSHFNPTNSFTIFPLNGSFVNPITFLLFSFRQWFF